MTHLPFNKEQQEILYQVFNVFGHMNASQLSEQTHNEFPWKNTYDPHKLFSKCIISPTVLYKFFKSKKNNI
ncbi:hypothetical protein MDPP_00142 [Candidatus Phytoplasma pini]|uniref:Antitoxin SocA-like Panacea domain-containing protein n=2 Tax=Candidatus Phytoplasma pini TaxID=267362 RepID=A0A559KJS8_9MOLU|nr:hypothetical protein MDPP_00142 [Candidatus Phytoplasma pini]